MPRFHKQYAEDKQVWKDSKWGLFRQRCLAQLTRMNLVPSPEPIPIFGTSLLEDKTVGSYMGKLRGFVNDFLLPNPQYDDSLVLFYPYTPKSSVTCSALAISHFTLSKFGTRGQPLKDFHDNPVLDNQGNPMLCLGGWKDPDNCFQLRSALRQVHVKAHDLVTDYTDLCEACFLLHEDDPTSGPCDSHPQFKRTRRLGNPSNTSLVADTHALIYQTYYHDKGGDQVWLFALVLARAKRAVGHGGVLLL